VNDLRSRTSKVMLRGKRGVNDGPVELPIGQIVKKEKKGGSYCRKPVRVRGSVNQYGETKKEVKEEIMRRDHSKHFPKSRWQEPRLGRRFIEKKCTRFGQRGRWRKAKGEGSRLTEPSAGSGRESRSKSGDLPKVLSGCHKQKKVIEGRISCLEKGKERERS